MNEKETNNENVIDINIKRKSNFSMFDNLAEEKQWIDRVSNHCLRECMKEVNE